MVQINSMQGGSSARSIRFPHGSACWFRHCFDVSAGRTEHVVASQGSAFQLQHVGCSGFDMFPSFGMFYYYYYYYCWYCPKDCHPEIKALIDQRLRALQNNDYETIKDITKLLKKTARIIRVNQQITALKDHAWEPVKYLKNNFVARHTKLRDRLGNLVPDNKRAEAQADYYEQVQWKPNEAEEYKQIVIDTQPIYE